MTLRLDVSFEFFPPAAGPAEAGFWTALDRLAPLEPGFISLTYGAGGTTRERNDNILRTLLARGCALPAGHLTCVGASRAETDTVAREWAAAGLRRVVALRGDMPGLNVPYAPHPDGYRNAAEMVTGLRHISDFDISVAAYPERHPDSADLVSDLDNLKRKFDAGADRELTQYLFDAETFLRFRDRARRAGIVRSTHSRSARLSSRFDANASARVSSADCTAALASFAARPAAARSSLSSLPRPRKTAVSGLFFPRYRTRSCCNASASAAASTAASASCFRDSSSLNDIAVHSTKKGPARKGGPLFQLRVSLCK